MTDWVGGDEIIHYQPSPGTTTEPLNTSLDVIIKFFIGGYFTKPFQNFKTSHEDMNAGA